MKKQILSLVLLAAVIGSTNAASAKIGNSDVPDNMLSLQARSAVDILTGKAARNPWEPCTASELKDRSCVKELYPNTMIVQDVQLPKDTKFVITILTEECQNQLEATLPNQNRIRIYTREYFQQNGRYGISNQAYNTCKVLLTIENQ